MTRIKFFADGTKLTGFEISDHSTENCDDIDGKTVCSAISSAAYMAANTITEIVKDKSKADAKDGYMIIRVDNPSEKTIAVLEGFKLHITELSKEYPKRIKIITEV